VKVESAELERRLEKYRAGFRAAGVKLTHQRLEIFREVASSLEHPDADAVFRRIRRRMPTVSLDTVYRTLWLLDELGLITTLGARLGSVRFDPNLVRHHHYLCVRCGLARDFTSTDLDGLRIPESVKRLGSVVATQVEVRGVCERCEKAKSGMASAGGRRRRGDKRRESNG
jgi:Fur family peroxide stress response transcriptional regulator